MARVRRRDGRDAVLVRREMHASAARSEGLHGETYTIKNYAAWWCPGNRGACAPEMRVPRDPNGPHAQEWIDQTARLTALACGWGAEARGTGCTFTRYVVCNTHDSNETNVCFLTWKECLENLAMRDEARRNPDDHCAAYFDGELLK